MTDWHCDRNTPSHICLDLDALETNIGTGVISTTVVSEWNLGANFPITDAFYHISTDPASVGVAGSIIDPAEGQVIDVYLVGWASNAVTGAPNTNGQMSGIHWQVTRTNGELVMLPNVERRITAGFTTADVATTTYNDLPPIAAFAYNPETFLNGAGFDIIASSFSDLYSLQLDGKYSNGTDIITVKEAIALGYEPCPYPDIALPEKCSVFGPNTIVYREPTRTDSVGGELGDHLPPDTNITINGLAVGDSVTEVLDFVAPEGKTIQVAMTVTNQVGGNHPLTIVNNGIFSHFNAGRYGLRFEVLTKDCDGNTTPVSMAFHNGSFQGSGEQWWVQGTGPRANLTDEDLIIWVNDQVIAAPASGVLTTPSNNQGVFLVGYENVTVVETAWNSQASVGSSMRMYLYDGPDVVELTQCELIEKLQTRLNNIPSLQTLEFTP